MTQPLIYPVPKAELDEWWERAQPITASFFTRAGGRYLPSDVLEKLKKGGFQLWLVIADHIIEAVGMTEVIQYPRLREMRIVMLAGEDREHWIHLMLRLEDYARQFGCVKLVGVARPGWEKPLKKYGFEKTHVFLEKDL